MTETGAAENLFTVRPAIAEDAAAISALIGHYAGNGPLLQRDAADILACIRNFLVAVTPQGGLLGCVAVRDFGNDLLEIRSLAVQPGLTGRGVGRELVAAAVVKAAAGRQEYRLFALTTTPAFFERLGFAVVSKERFPEKIWSDCSRCPKADRCDESAVLYQPAKGAVPPQA